MTTEAPIKPEAQPLATQPAVARDFAELADDAALERTAAALRAKGYEVFVADDAATARQIVLDAVPKGAEVSQGASKTLEELGITSAIEESGEYDAVRPKTRKLDYSTEEGRAQGRRMGAVPEYWLNSVHAVTEDGRFLIASNTGSQLGPIAFGAGHVVLVIGTHKIVRDLDEGMRRLEEHILPLENQRMQGLYGIDSAISKVLIFNREPRAGRITVVLVKEPVGF